MGMGSRSSRLNSVAAVMVLCVVVSAAIGAAASPLIDVDADALPIGPVESWANKGLAGGSFDRGADKAPQATTVQGRRAVQFDTTAWLKSSFNAPDSLTGGKPFTVAMWAYTKKLHGKEVTLSWASRPDDTAEFGYGKSREGAFCGWLRDTGFANVPPPTQWHHIAYTYADGDFRVYVDGDLDITRTFRLSPRKGEKVLLGAAWDRKKNEAAFVFHGALARIRVWDRTLSHREVRNDAGCFEPFTPVPSDGQIVDDCQVSLAWQAGGADSRSFRVFISEDRAAVERGLAPPRLCSESSTQIPGLALGKTYFWRIEPLDATGKPLKSGPVWSFTLSAGPATSPLPRNRVAGVQQTTTELSWTPGRYAVSQDLYFGTDEAAVAGSTTPALKNLSATTSRAAIPVQLESGRTYYWRVDQNNGSLPGAKGTVWAFRTVDQPIPNDITFFVISDTHYGLDPRGDLLLPRLVDQMNWIPGAKLPDSLGGGIVRTPRGVIHIGDITNDGRDDQWKMFLRDYGLRGEARLAWPVYEAFGNHDGGVKNPIRIGINERNKQRSGLAHLSANGMHYSWDWDHVHFINLNISIGDTFHPYDPQHSYEFLVNDLSKHGHKPLILLHHFGFDKHSLTWWKEEAREKYHAAIRGKDILGIFHGHSHETNIFKWNGLDVFDTPHLRVSETVLTEPAKHGFFVVRITPTEMIVAERRSDDTWGMSHRKPLRN